MRIEDIEEIPNRPDPRDPAAKVILRNMKGVRTELFPLSDAALDVVKCASDSRTSGPVFINPHTGEEYKNMSETFYNTVQRLGLTVEVDGKKHLCVSMI